MDNPAVQAPPSALSDPTSRRWRQVLVSYFIPSVLTLALMIGCQLAAGWTLGLFIGGIAVAAIITPGLVLAEQTPWRRLIAWAGVVDAILIIWLLAVVQSEATAFDWLEVTLVLVLYSAAAALLATALHALKLPAVAAAAITVVLGLAWLTWPIWMAPWLTGAHRETVVAALVKGHPLFAVNGALMDAFGVAWAQVGIIYRLTNIGDDIPYEMPSSVWPSAAVHLAVSASCAGVLWLAKRRRVQRGDVAGAASLAS